MKFDKGLVAVVLICTLVFTTLNFAQDTLFNDGYYHIQFANQMKSEIGMLPKSLPNIYYSIWNTDFTDKHYLFHLALIPFTFFDDLVFGAKIANIFFAILMFVAFYFLMKKMDVNNPAIATIFLGLCSSTFIFRMILPRAISFGILFLILGLYFIKDKNYKALGITAFLFVWAYAAYPILIVSVFVLLIIEYFFFREKYFENVEHNRNVIKYVLIGTLLGIIINPFFPANIINAVNVDLEASLFRIPELGNVEWSSTSSIDFLSGSALVFGLVFFVIFIYLKRGEKMELPQMKYFLLCVFLIILSAKAIRIVDFLIPFLVIFTFSALTKLGYHFSIDWKDMKQLLVAGLVMAVMLVPAGASYMYYQNLEYSDFSECANWISENVPEKSIIYNAVYDDFPQLYFYLPNHYFISGMDEYYLYKYDKDLWQLQRDFWDGNVSAEKISENFNTQTIFIEKSQRKNLTDKLKKRDDYKLEFENTECSVFSIT
ncbi:MAG: hypothetical protein V1672_01340 [Candidatus Diapherotrites archaeon]